jgi:MFS transporter, APGE family, 1-arseno-3-phosphoglycerate exporter
MVPATRNYLLVTASYWGFTLTDGALRMLVLLYFFKLGYSPFTLAFLFVLYELAGILANLGGGWLATRFGIPRMLMIGQLLQIVGLVMLSALDPAWSALLAVAWVVAAQGIAGLAKDFYKDRLQVGDQGNERGGGGPALQVGGVVHRVERPLGANIGLSRYAMADGGSDWRDPGDEPPFAAA